MKTLIIDNYDSYTFNLYQLIAAVNGECPTVIPNDRLQWDEIDQTAFDNIVISPGPGRPENIEDFGICAQVIQNTTIPLLGVCLGHQGIAWAYGAKIVHASEVCHGRLSEIYHQETDLFSDIPAPFSVVRYHSLIAADPLPDCLEKIAWTRDGVVMGLRHRSLPLWGVQFHPESVCTEHGRKLLENFQEITLNFLKARDRNPSKQLFSMPIKTVHTPKHSTSNSVNQKCQPEFELLTHKLEEFPDSEQLFVHLFGKVKHAFWLDSNHLELGLSRFSFMGDSCGENSLVIRYQVLCHESEFTRSAKLTVTKSNETIQEDQEILEYLEQQINQRKCLSPDLPFDFNCGFVGYFGYELRADCGTPIHHPSPLPDAMFLFADRMIALDHQTQTLHLLCLTRRGDSRSAETWFTEMKQQIQSLPPLPPPLLQKSSHPLIFQLSRSRQTYLKNIQTCLQKIHDGETYQICLTNQITTQATPDPLTFYRILRRINPAPYAAFLKFEDIAIACSSPERFLRLDRHGNIETKPIKGTAPRGANPDEDKMFREQLQHNEKERAENLMITDLLRNDLGRVCAIGTVQASKLMHVETYATVHQLVSTIQGCLAPHTTAIDCIRSTFPGGSMTGAPKLRTLQILDQLEQEARGVYSGAIGFLGLNGSADLNIVIRTAVLTPDQTTIGIGGGITALSNPEMEFQETLLKSKALIQAILFTTFENFDFNQFYLQGI